TRKKEQERQRLLWQIPYMQLRKPPTSRELQQQSKRSLQSGKSVLTGDSKLTESNFGDYEIYFLEGNAVLTTKYPVTGLTDEDGSRFPQMRRLDHDNVNRFIGLSVDGAEYVAIWRMVLGICTTLSSEPMVVSDRECLVTDSWQVKISDYGTGSLREEERLKKKRLLWMAPEHLRSPDTSSKASKEGDVYSFAIIAS
ncbi:hypothetical protein OSTOST_23602, partial [Ostertagia ostertagi]